MRSFSPAQENTDRVFVLLIALFILAAFYTLYLLRELDDNRLTSWQWVFKDVNLVYIGALLVGSLIVAYMLSRLSFLENHPVIFLFISSFLVSVVFWRVPEVNVDAARYFTQAKYLAQYGIGSFLSGWGREISAWTDLPLIPFLYGVIFSLVGETRVAVQAFTTLLFSGAVVLTYLVGKALWDKSVGFYGGLLLLGMPYLLTQVPLMLIDVPIMFFFILAIFAVIKAFQQGGAGWLALASLALTLSLFSKYSMWALLTVVAVIVAIYLGERPMRNLRQAAIIGLTPTVLFSIFFLLKSEVIAEQLRLLFSYQLQGLARWRESFISTFFFQMSPLIPALAAASFIAAFRKRDLKYAIISWSVLLPLLARVERIRYLLPIFPMVALMASYGLHALGSPRLKRFIVFSIILSSLVIASFVYLPFLMKISAVNLKTAGEYLNSLEGDTIEVFTLPRTRSAINPAVLVPLLDIFTSKRIVYHPLPGLLIPPKGVEQSPLRFTWEYKIPPYYASQAGGLNGTAKVLILSHPNQPLPEEVKRNLTGYHLSRTFDTTEGVFRGQTIVKVYEPEAKS